MVQAGFGTHPPPGYCGGALIAADGAIDVDGGVIKAAAEAGAVYTLTLTDDLAAIFDNDDRLVFCITSIGVAIRSPTYMLPGGASFTVRFFDEDGVLATSDFSILVFRIRD